MASLICKIINISKNFIISKDAKIARNFFDKTFGLLIPQNPKSMIFKTRFGIHTFFLKVPIDILVLDNKKNVVKIKENLVPNKFFFWNIKYSCVLELPAMSINNSQTKLGDKIDLSFDPKASNC